MGFKERYIRAKIKFINDKGICNDNRQLYDQYLKWQERKLKSINDLRELDEACYKTLYHYICMFKNINKWFNNKPLKQITKQGIHMSLFQLFDMIGYKIYAPKNSGHIQIPD